MINISEEFKRIDIEKNEIINEYRKLDPATISVAEKIGLFNDDRLIAIENKKIIMMLKISETLEQLVARLENLK